MRFGEKAGDVLSIPDAPVFVEVIKKISQIPTIRLCVAPASGATDFDIARDESQG
jgi:hypothetical protein